MAERVTTVEQYVEKIGPHLQHGTYRADDIPGRLLGLGCREHGVECQISIKNFKATGDLAVYEPLAAKWLPEEKKK